MATSRHDSEPAGQIPLIGEPGTALSLTPVSEKSWGVVWVNPFAKSAYLNPKATSFPVGSVILREKRATPDSPTPEAVVAMIKRMPGFNPAGGDWEFVSARGDRRSILETTKTGSCLECHQQVSGQNFVFRPATKTEKDQFQRPGFNPESLRQ